MTSNELRKVADLMDSMSNNEEGCASIYCDAKINLEISTRHVEPILLSYPMHSDKDIEGHNSREEK